MFSKNSKKHYTTFIYVAVIITLCLLIIALAWPQDVEKANSDEPNDTDPGSVVSNNNVDNNDDDDNDDDDLDDDKDDYSSSQSGDNDDNNDNNGSDDENNNIRQGSQSYYLVKRAGDQVVVYFCGESGDLVQLETTRILYELLVTEDQKLFDEGIKVNSQEELGVLLKDFES